MDASTGNLTVLKEKNTLVDIWKSPLSNEVAMMQSSTANKITLFWMHLDFNSGDIPFKVLLVDKVAFDF